MQIGYCSMRRSEQARAGSRPVRRVVASKTPPIDNPVSALYNDDALRAIAGPGPSLNEA